MPLLATTYCTVLELQNYLSTQGVTDFADHDQDGTADTDVVESAINRATLEINRYARHKHTEAQLASHDLITEWCKVMAARYLTKTRGNVTPESIEVDYQEEIKPALEGIRSGSLPLVGLPLSGNYVPTVQNYKIDRRYRHRKIRRRPTSTGPTSALREDRVQDVPGFWE